MIEIKTNTGITEIIINGIKMTGVTALTVKVNAEDRIPVVMLTFIDPDTHIEMDDAVVWRDLQE
jgi:hypothetical protein